MPTLLKSAMAANKAHRAKIKSDGKNYDTCQQNQERSKQKQPDKSAEDIAVTTDHYHQEEYPSSAADLLPLAQTSITSFHPCSRFSIIAAALMAAILTVPIERWFVNMSLT